MKMFNKSNCRKPDNATQVYTFKYTQICIPSIPGYASIPGYTSIPSYIKTYLQRLSEPSELFHETLNCPVDYKQDHKARIENGSGRMDEV